jgi:MFS family permease
VRAASSQRPGVFDVLQSGLRRRFAVLITLSAAGAMVAGSAFGFASYRATNTFGWTPTQVSTMILTAGGLGLSGWFVFGRLADLLGRRIVGVVGLIGGAASIFAYYRTPWLLPSFAAIVFLEAGVAVALNSLGTELFPTILRATAKAWITNAGIIGGMAGLAVVGALSEHLGGAEVVISLLAFVPAATTPLLFLLPETRGRVLEELEPEAPVAGRALRKKAG